MCDECSFFCEPPARGGHSWPCICCIFVLCKIGFALHCSNTGLDFTVGYALTSLGWQKESYMASVLNSEHFGEEPELAFLSHLLGLQLRVFLDDGEFWQECTHYGTSGPLRRLFWQPDRVHYDVIIVHENTESEDGTRPRTASQPHNDRPRETQDTQDKNNKRRALTPSLSKGKVAEKRMKAWTENRRSSRREKLTS